MSSVPLLLAGLAALGWGVADYAVARVGEEVETLATFAYAQVGGAVAAVLLAALIGVGPPAPGKWPALLAVGVVGAVAYLLLYAALQVGPVAVASPVAATNGGVAAVLGVLLLGETLGTPATAGLVLVTAGVVAASLQPDALRAALAGSSPVLPGAGLGAVAALVLGATLFLLDLVADAASPLLVVLVVRIVGSVLGVPLAEATVERPARAMLPWVVGIGVVDAVAFGAFVLALRGGKVAVVAPISSLFAVVTVALAWALLREPLSLVQKAGVAVTLVGLPLLSRG